MKTILLESHDSKFVTHIRVKLGLTGLGQLYLIEQYSQENGIKLPTGDQIRLWTGCNRSTADFFEAVFKEFRG